MQFDVVIIGGGLAGLTSGIRLSEQGKRCAIVSAGQSALHFSSGSLDFLSRMPDGSAIQTPLAALAQLAEKAPQHPYSRLGVAQVTQMAQQAERLLADCGIALIGDIHQNHYRVTPMGTLRSTWLSPMEVPISQDSDSLPWQSIAVIGIEGFLDFHPELAASSLQALGINAFADFIHLPALDRLRGNPSEFRAINIARVLDLPEHLQGIAEELTRLTKDTEAIVMPACIGLENSRILSELSALVGKPVLLVPTLPPSLLGMRMHQALRRRFQQLGGMFMPGDSVLKADITRGHIQGLYTRNHTDIPLIADHVILASGSFFNNGLIAEFDRIYEPVFNLDVMSAEQRAGWSQKDMFAPQPYLQFGVKTDENLRGLQNGQPIDNLYAIGAVLGGYDPIQQGCGAGVSLVSAMHAAEMILASEEVAV